MVSVTVVNVLLIPLPNIGYTSALSVIEMRRPAARVVQLTGYDSELRFRLHHADRRWSTFPRPHGL